MTDFSCRIDFTCPQQPDAARLRHAFGTPRTVLVAHALDEVRAVLDAVHLAAQQGAWCVGYVAYEAAAAFDRALKTHPAEGPLAWFAVHDEPLPWPLPEALGTTPDALGKAHHAAQVAWQHSLEREAFDSGIARIQSAIANGEVYQINYTAPLHGTLQQGSPTTLFDALLRAQPQGYVAFLDAGDHQVLSVSPELFFDWQTDDQGGQILARPMKGTAPRGATPQADAAYAQHLRTSPKERAENVMIVDLLRNDLSRIAQPHSVQVPRLFHTEALPTVWQMTSDVQARTAPGTTLTDVFAALFPCGSITGAPKVRAMQLIQEVEPSARGIYCGAIGVVRPQGPAGQGGVAATFNVPIRTVVLRAALAQPGHPVVATCGIGSGITSGAEATAEWNEWRHKRAFVERASEPFELVETLALHEGQWRHGAEHLQRMERSAAHFGFAWDADRVQACLQAVAEQHEQAQGLWRVRLLLDSAGVARAQAFALSPTVQPVRLQLAERAFFEADSEFVRHKTTRRAHYAAFAPTDSTVFDTVLWNPAGELTESTFGNIAVLLDGRWVTPALGCGLLAGIGRQVALRQGRVSEAVVHLSDVPRVQGWAFINSLRGWMNAELVPAPPMPKD